MINEYCQRFDCCSPREVFGFSSKINWYAKRVDLNRHNDLSIDARNLSKTDHPNFRFGAPRSMISNGMPVFDTDVTSYPAVFAILIKLFLVKNRK